MNLMTYLDKGLWLGLAAIGFAVLFNVPRRALGLVFVIGAVGGLAKIFLAAKGVSIVLSVLCGATLIGFLSVLAAHRRKAPPMIFAIPAVIPMIPGFFAYQTMVGIIELTTIKEPAAYSKLFFETVNNGLTALSVVFALACGVAIPMLITRKQTVKRLSTDDNLDVEIE